LSKWDLIGLKNFYTEKAMIKQRGEEAHSVGESFLTIQLKRSSIYKAYANHKQKYIYAYTCICIYAAYTKNSKHKESRKPTNQCRNRF
jgi:predicted SprT family Zn-dependent metalloprotease